MDPVVVGTVFATLGGAMGLFAVAAIMLNTGSLGGSNDRDHMDLFVGEGEGESDKGDNEDEDGKEDKDKGTVEGTVEGTVGVNDMGGVSLEFAAAALVPTVLTAISNPSASLAQHGGDAVSYAADVVRQDRARLHAVRRRVLMRRRVQQHLQQLQQAR